MIDKGLSSLRVRAGRKRLLAVHGNRFITHLVLASLPEQFLDERRPLPPDTQGKVSAVTKAAFDAAIAVADAVFPEAYLGSLFKNTARCQTLKKTIDLTPIKAAAA